MAQRARGGRDGSWGALALHSLLVAVAYIVAGKISLLLRHPLGGISPLWLPSAVALAAVMWGGPRLLTAVAAASVAGSVSNGFPVASAFTGAAASVCELLLAHALLRRSRTDLHNMLDGVKQALRFVLAVMPAALLGAALGVAGLLATGPLSGGIAEGLALWFAGDFVGMVLFVPLVAAAVRRTSVGDKHHAFAWVPMSLAVGSTVVIFFLTDQSRVGHHVFGYLVFPFVVWSALAAGTPGATLTHTLVGGLAIVGTAMGLGPYAVTGGPTDVGLLQTFVVAVVGTSLFLSTAMADRRRMLALVRHQATHDALTGFLNRRGLQGALDQALARAMRDGTAMSLLFVDLDDFSGVNDTIGHEGGDRVLVEIAERLRRVASRGEVIVRPGGDEFVVVCGYAGESANGLARRIVEAVREPVTIDDRTFRLTCSVGIARHPQDGDDPATLMRLADIAMYQAKRGGKNAYLAITQEVLARRMARVEIEGALRAAVARGAFSLHFQPQIDIKTGRLVGAEALLRWNDDNLGAVPPSIFVPMAEDIGLVDSIGDWVIDNVCAQLRRWIDAGLEPPRTAVNLSPMQLGPALATRWKRALDEARLPADLLEAELTESCVMRDERGSLVALESLQRQGVRVSLDDFGTGQSSLSLLTRLPLDAVKIDQSFVNQVGRPDGAQVVGAVVSLVHRLGLRCLAEGVETEAQEAFLRDVGCDAYQGFLVSRALPADQFEQRFLGPTSRPAEGTVH
jgi:diguanylate cyclase (GGDEF)-like protein